MDDCLLRPMEDGLWKVTMDTMTERQQKQHCKETKGYDDCNEKSNEDDACLAAPSVGGCLCVALYVPLYVFSRSRREK